MEILEELEMSFLSEQEIYTLNEEDLSLGRGIQNAINSDVDFWIERVGNLQRDFKESFNNGTLLYEEAVETINTISFIKSKLSELLLRPAISEFTKDRIVETYKSVEKNRMTLEKRLSKLTA